MSNSLDILTEIVNNTLFIVTVVIFITYLTLMVYSAIALRKYLRKNSYVNYNSIITSPLAPSVSVIVPGYNESISIVDNIRTLLSLYYSDFEIVVVNDGSTDDTMEKIIEAYELEKVNYYFDYRLPCERVKAVYKSRNRSYKKLLVVDKRNGGKADALNAGLNVVKNDLVVCIDADSIMEQDALMKLAKPFLEVKDKKLIGAGGVIRIANSCEIQAGKITKIRVPKKWLPRAQVMEYTRAFLMGRIAWSELDGLLLISGALGMFNREILIEAGGYSTNTVGEDMELVVRIRMFMADKGIPYEVAYIPDPLCWTEVPSTVKTLGLQRSRWTRGTIETLYTHRKLFLNKKYGKLGLLGYPYWLLFEWFAPILEFIGILIFIFLAISGRLNLDFFFLLLGFVYFFSVSLSIWSIFFEEITFHKYEKRRDVLKLVLTAFLEPFFYHPLVLAMNIKGNIDKLLKKTSWGTQEREGFIKAGTRKDWKTRMKEMLHKRKYFIGIGSGFLIALALFWLIIKGTPDIQPEQNSTPVYKTQVEGGTKPDENTTPDESTLPDEVASDSSHAVVSAQKKYHIIVGSFKSQENAHRVIENLKNMGYEPEILPGEDSLARIALYTLDNRQEALDALKELRSEPGWENAWLWVK